jgi:topoisomerase IA-like protein
MLINPDKNIRFHPLDLTRMKVTWQGKDLPYFATIGCPLCDCYEMKILTGKFGPFLKCLDHKCKGTRNIEQGKVPEEALLQAERLAQKRKQYG